MRFVTVLVVVYAGWLCGCDAGIEPVVRLCGRRLSLMMSRLCQEYNSPLWENQSAMIMEPGLEPARRKRSNDLGIADLCCKTGCTWGQLSDFCSGTDPELMRRATGHQIEDRSAESVAGELLTPPEVVAPAAAERAARASSVRRASKVGRRSDRGYGRRCRCRRRRREGRRQNSLMGNMERVNVERAAPVVGTVSPLLTWGRTLNTDLPYDAAEHDRFTYVAVYAQPYH